MHKESITNRKYDKYDVVLSGAAQLFLSPGIANLLFLEPGDLPIPSLNEWGAEV